MVYLLIFVGFSPTVETKLCKLTIRTNPWGSFTQSRVFTMTRHRCKCDLIWPKRSFYPPQTKFRKGNVFTSMCQEFCPQRKGGGHIPPRRHYPTPQTPPRPDTTPVGRQPPPGKTPLPLGRHLPRQTATAADGTHPTGMHSCSIFVSNTIHKIYMTQKCLLKFKIKSSFVFTI